MKIKAGDNVGIGGSVRSGNTESAFWKYFKDVSWLVVTVLLIIAAVIVYVTSRDIEAVSIFTGLIGVALGHAIGRFIKPID